MKVLFSFILTRRRLVHTIQCIYCKKLQTNNLFLIGNRNVKTASSGCHSITTKLSQRGAPCYPWSMQNPHGSRVPKLTVTPYYLIRKLFRWSFQGQAHIKYRTFSSLQTPSLLTHHNTRAYLPPCHGNLTSLNLKSYIV